MTTRRQPPSMGASPIKKALRENFDRLAKMSPEAYLKRQRKPAYLSGAKAGQEIKRRTLRYALTPSSPIMPGLDLIEALAHDLGCLPAELLINWDRDGERLMRRIMLATPQPQPPVAARVR